MYQMVNILFYILQNIISEVSLIYGTHNYT